MARSRSTKPAVFEGQIGGPALLERWQPEIARLRVSRVVTGVRVRELPVKIEHLLG